MIGLEERQEILKSKIDSLSKIIDDNELTYCSNNIKVLVHEIKGLCGLFGYSDLFNLLCEMERAIGFNDFELFHSKFRTLQNYNFELINCVEDTINTRKIYRYILSFLFTNITTLNQIIRIISDCSVIVDSKMFNNKIVLYLYTYCDKKSIELLCKTYMISVKKVNNFAFKSSGGYIYEVIKNRDCFNDKYFHLFLLESITNIARIANKKFHFDYKSNSFVLNNKFISDFYIVFAELIKNVFSHSGRNDGEIIKVKCLMKNRQLYFSVFNYGNKIKRKDRKLIFNESYSTSHLNCLSGQGIGLYDVKKTLLNFGGTVSFKNKFRGTVFDVKVPIDKYRIKERNH